MKNHLRKKENPQENIKRVKKLNKLKTEFNNIAGWSSLVARQAHNLKVGGSNPSPATNSLKSLCLKFIRFFHQLKFLI